MNKRFASIALACLIGTPVLAGTMDFPKSGETLIQITIPDEWKPDADDDVVLESTSPDGHISLSIWEIESSTTVDTVADDLQEILKDYAKEVTLDEAVKKVDVSGLPGFFFAGSGADPDDDRPLGFVAFAIVRDDRAVIVFFEIDSNYTADELKTLESIIESIHVPKK